MCQAINQQLVDAMEERLTKSFPTGEYEISDGDGMHLQVMVKSADFQNRSLIEQHKMVYAALDDLLKSGELHSINIKTTPLGTMHATGTLP
ncbi:MAG: BolA/IbaG family iron-sulfur metabolism protein [Candidatus Gracilibacteria bacterium]